ncbi:hypothetical protein WDY80_16150 [Gordonia hongkongensis]|uniref:hypothetical protein n=1 Tax=Gordonia hongkongensis TaxID=1701090 RepID=UPI0030CE3628
MKAGADEWVARLLADELILISGFHRTFGLDQDFQPELLGDRSQIDLLIEGLEDQNELRVGGLDRVRELDLRTERGNGLLES